MATKADKAEQLFAQAEKKEEAGDLKDAFDLLTQAAQLGDASAQVNLGNYYASGTGVEKSFENAARWYKAAYRNGNCSGANNLAIDLRNQGRTKEAILWFKRAIALNDGDASVELAKLIKDQPNGVEEAIKYLKRAIEMKRCDITDYGKARAKRLLRRLENPANPTSVRRRLPAKQK